MANEYDEAVKDAEMILREYEQGDDVSWVEPQHVRRLSRAVLAMAKRLEVPTGEDAAWVARMIHVEYEWSEGADAVESLSRRVAELEAELAAERAPFSEHEWAQARALANGWPFHTVGITEEDEEIRAGLEDWRKSGEAARVVLRRLLDHIEKLEAERRDMIAFAKGLGEKTWGHLLAQDYEAGKHVGAAGKEAGR